MTSKLGNNIIKLKRKLGIKGVYYEQRRNTKKSREENRHGDELEKAKKETALNGTKYVYLKQKKRFVYYDILVTWSSWMSYVYSEIIVNVSLNNLLLTNKYEINRMSNENH